MFGLCCSPCTTCKIMLLKQNIEQSQQKKLKRVNYFIKKQQIKCQPSLNIYISLSSGVISCSFFNRSLSGDWARNLLNNSFVMMDLSARSLKVKRYLSQGKWRESFLTNKESLFYVSFATNKYWEGVYWCHVCFMHFKARWIALATARAKSVFCRNLN